MSKLHDELAYKFIRIEKKMKSLNRYKAAMLKMVDEIENRLSVLELASMGAE